MRKTVLNEDASIRDLSDFCLQWPELKKQIECKNAPRTKWTNEAEDILDWLITLADKTCRLDVNLPSPKPNDPK